MKIFIKAIGCKVSQHDALATQEFLERFGHHFISEIKEADYAIVQTCTVTQKSDSEARQLIRQIKKKNPEVKIIVTGCYAQRAPEELVPLEVARVVGNLDPHKWQLLLEEIQKQKEFAESADAFPDESFAQSTRTFDKTRPYLKIYDGCNHNCSYCIVPSVRGKGRSLPPDQIILQLNKLLQCGYKEIIITGVNIASYGKDLTLPDGLCQLAQEFEKINADFRVRFSSVEPSSEMKKFIEFACNSKKIVPHFHLPIQHINQKILNDMRRPYQFEEFDEIINMIHTLRKDACIGSDIIVGFPTETEIEFQDCFSYLKKSPIAYLHVFHFSPRPGTAAFSMKPASTDSTIKERSFKLRELSDLKFSQFKNRFAGHELKILTFRYNNKNILTGLSENYIHAPVKHSKKNVPENALIAVRYCEDQFLIPESEVM